MADKDGDKIYNDIVEEILNKAKEKWLNGQTKVMEMIPLNE
ncbi:hypothetical protein [Clostridium sp. JS66]|nr:hypothetical protein [Clostridium sp. JS66]WPC42676.1 hypothetical protein Q6H37_04170 [Clostridium sp. JS66]